MESQLLPRLQALFLHNLSDVMADLSGDCSHRQALGLARSARLLAFEGSFSLLVPTNPLKLSLRWLFGMGGVSVCLCVGGGYYWLETFQEGTFGGQWKCSVS